MEDSNVISLADRSKNLIFDDFQRLNRQHTMVLNAKSSYGRHFALKLFVTKYAKFMNNVMCIDMYEQIKKEVKDKAEKYRYNLDKIKSNEDVDEVIYICIALVRGLKITKISFFGNDDAF